MRFLPLALLITGIAAVIWGQSPPEKYTFVLSGDTKGYLSPCGCTKPMVGGIRRRATAIEQLTRNSIPVVLENGGLIEEANEQSVLKAETLAEALRVMGATAINLSYSEARLGPGLLISINQLSGEKLTSIGLGKTATNSVTSSVIKGKFLIGGYDPRAREIASALNETPVSESAALQSFLAEAENLELIPVLMLQAGRNDALRLARNYPALALIHYSSVSTPPAKPDQVGQTLLITPGDKGKALIKIDYSAGKWRNYEVIKLAPQFRDDREVHRIFQTYQWRIKEAKLLEKLPRIDGNAFSGNKKCGSCHAKAYEVWQASKHAEALKTLEKESHSRDPDCVACHVVHLESKAGFRSRAETPQLANVGCESCHGAGESHSQNPYKIKMPVVGDKSCKSCHVPDHSPGFDYEKYWNRIRH